MSEQDARDPQAGCLRSSMITFQIAGYLTEFTAGAAEIKIDASPATVGDALNDLWERHAGLKDRVLTEQGEVRQHVNIFVNSSIVRRDQVLVTPLKDAAEICIMPAVSGGFLTDGTGNREGIKRKLEGAAKRLQRCFLLFARLLASGRQAPLGLRIFG